MQEFVPSGNFKLIVLVPAQYLDAFKQTGLLKTYDKATEDLVIMDESEKPYFEVNLDDAYIHDVVMDLMAGKVEADIQVLPLFDDSEAISYNAFVRNIDNDFKCFINSKDDENSAYELHLALLELNKHNIHEADEIMLKRIDALHSLKVGWLI